MVPTREASSTSGRPNVNLESKLTFWPISVQNLDNFASSPKVWWRNDRTWAAAVEVFFPPLECPSGKYRRRPGAPRLDEQIHRVSGCCEPPSSIHTKDISHFWILMKRSTYVGRTFHSALRHGRPSSCPLNQRGGLMPRFSVVHSIHPYCALIYP